MVSPTRLRTHADAAASLALLSDHALAELVASGTPAGTGIGGRATLLEVDGVRIFVKRVPLTATELEPGHVRSTANIFDLPPHFHYGIGAIGSPGFGAWRELAVHEMTTDWVRSGSFPGFPLLHHWRVLPDLPHCRNTPRGRSRQKMTERGLLALVSAWRGPVGTECRQGPGRQPIGTPASRYSAAPRSRARSAHRNRS